MIELLAAAIGGTAVEVPPLEAGELIRVVAPNADIRGGSRPGSVGTTAGGAGAAGTGPDGGPGGVAPESVGLWVVGLLARQVSRSRRALSLAFMLSSQLHQ